MEKMAIPLALALTCVAYAGSAQAGPDAPAIGEKGATAPVRAFLIPVQPEEGANVSIEEVLTPRVAIHRDEPAQVRVTMRNHSTRSEARFPLRIRFDGKIVIEREITIPPLSARAERFELPVERAGWIRGEVFKNPDRQRRDDRRFFTIFARERTEVLLLGGAENIYLKTALDPEGGGGDVALSEKSWDELTTGDLDMAETVVTGTAGDPTPAEISLLGRFVRSYAPKPENEAVFRRTPT